MCVDINRKKDLNYIFWKFQVLVEAKCKKWRDYLLSAFCIALKDSAPLCLASSHLSFSWCSNFIRRFSQSSNSLLFLLTSTLLSPICVRMVGPVPASFRHASPSNCAVEISTVSARLPWILVPLFDLDRGAASRSLATPLLVFFDERTAGIGKLWWVLVFKGLEWPNFIANCQSFCNYNTCLGQEVSWNTSGEFAICSDFLPIGG